jgi:hypothetical protein
MADCLVAVGTQQSSNQSALVRVVDIHRRSGPWLATKFRLTDGTPVALSKPHYFQLLNRNAVKRL